MDDELIVATRLKDMRGASLILDQEILRAEERLIEAEVSIVCIGAGRAMRLPPALRSAMSAWLARESPVSTRNLQG
jgi:acyl-CoA thioester hydrolase